MSAPSRSSPGRPTGATLSGHSGSLVPSSTSVSVGPASMGA